jgi:hypothetical protein
MDNFFNIGPRIDAFRKILSVLVCDKANDVTDLKNVEKLPSQEWNSTSSCNTNISSKRAAQKRQTEQILNTVVKIFVLF